MADPIRITVDPSTQLCPEYEDPSFAPFVESLRHHNGTEPHAAVIQCLQAAWVTYNDQRQQAWAAQVKTDHIAAEAIEAAHRAADETQQKESEEQVALEAEKKKLKLGDFDDSLSVSNHVVHCPSAFATEKLSKGELVELWYLTPQGCKDATENQSVTASDVLSFVTNNDSIALQPTSSLQASRKAISDHELTFSDMCTVKSLFLLEITRLGWAERYVRSFRNFFYVIENHPHRCEPITGEKDLILYQAEVRKQWHDDLKQGIGFNIG